jgi:hypothetical protein
VRNEINKVSLISFELMLPYETVMSWNYRKVVFQT